MRTDWVGGENVNEGRAKKKAKNRERGETKTNDQGGGTLSGKATKLTWVGEIKRKPLVGEGGGGSGFLFEASQGIKWVEGKEEVLLGKKEGVERKEADVSTWGRRRIMVVLR